MPDGSEAEGRVWAGLRQAAQHGRLAHGYLVIGSPRGGGLDAAVRLLQMVFCSTAGEACGRCQGCRRVRERIHPDIHWIEPASRSRQITVGDPRDPVGDPGIRFGILEPIARTPIEGGWKAGVILAADRMTAQAANALLKTLEEPPPQTLLILVSDAPQAILPTIRSRCQEVVIRRDMGSATEPWRSRWLDLLADIPPRTAALEALAISARIEALWRELEQSVAAEQSTEECDPDVVEARRRARYLEVRQRLLDEWLGWERDRLAIRVCGPEVPLRNADRLDDLQRSVETVDPSEILTRIRRLEGLGRRLALNLPPSAALPPVFMGEP